MAYYDCDNYDHDYYDDDYDYDQEIKDRFPALFSEDSYIELKRLITDVENYRRFSDTELGVIDYMFDNPGEDLSSIICDLKHSVSDIVSLAILKDIYKNAGRHIHWCLREYIIYSKLNPLKKDCNAHLCSYKKYFQEVMSTFVKDFSSPVQKEEVVLDQEKQPLTWWKEQVKDCIAEGERSGSDGLA